MSRTPPWNKGLTNETDERVRRGSESKIKLNRLVDGYVQNKNVRKHRQVFMGWLGLKNIPKGQVIHHLDGNKQNNDMNNLMMLSRSEHAKLHSEVEMELGIRKGLFKQKYFEPNTCVECEQEIGRYAKRCKRCNNILTNKKRSKRCVK